MSVWKTYSFTMFKILIFLVIGFFLTQYGLKRTYESFGISFTGDVWVNWFGVSYLLFFLYTITIGIFINKNNNSSKNLKSSFFFWLLFIGSIYVIFIPFIKGENPF